MKKYIITDVKGKRCAVTASDMRAAIQFHEMVLEAPEPIKVKLVKG